MHPAGEGPTSLEEERRLRSTLQRFVSDAQAREVEILGWTREPSPVAVPGVFPIDVLRLSLRDGGDVTLFVKQLGPEQADHPDKQRRDREPRIYEELLSGDGLPVPRYYGSRRNEATGRHELYLEYVGDWSLKYQDLDLWFPAARRLGALHARFAGRAAELSECDYLLRLDAAYFRGWAERALAAAAEHAAVLAEALRPVVDRYDRVATLIARQPPTLVHNDLAPKNVLADRSRRPARICFVDWEMAGVGCGLLDLVHLTDGLGPAADSTMRAAYCQELAGTGLLPSAGRELRRLFAACEIHHILHRLASSRLWRPLPAQVAEWVNEVRDLAAALAEGGGP